MDSPSTLAEIFKQGGFAALAALALWFLKVQNERHVADLKDSLAREIESRRDIRAIVDGTISAMRQVSSDLAALTSAITASLDDTWRGRKTGVSGK